eukprot:7736939-Pyramimonas_sp.AAC.1
MLSKRVAHLGVAGHMERVDRLIGHEESVFGEINGDSDDLTNCGIHQHRSADGVATLDQDEYIDALIPNRRVDLAKAKADEPTG